MSRQHIRVLDRESDEEEEDDFHTPIPIASPQVVAIEAATVASELPPASPAAKSPVIHEEEEEGDQDADDMGTVPIQSYVSDMSDAAPNPLSPGIGVAAGKAKSSAAPSDQLSPSVNNIQINSPESISSAARAQDGEPAVLPPPSFAENSDAAKPHLHPSKDQQLADETSPNHHQTRADEEVPAHLPPGATINGKDVAPKDAPLLSANPHPSHEQVLQETLDSHTGHSHSKPAHEVVEEAEKAAAAAAMTTPVNTNAPWKDEAAKLESMAHRQPVAKSDELPPVDEKHPSHPNGTSSSSSASGPAAAMMSEDEHAAALALQSANRRASEQRREQARVDRWGNIRPLDEEELLAQAKKNPEQIKAERAQRAARLILDQERESKWVKMVSNWDRTMSKRSDKIKRRIRKGIPDSIRGAVWPRFTGALDLMRGHQPSAGSSSLPSAHASRIGPGVYQQCLNQHSKEQATIARDIARTFPRHVLFRDTNADVNDPAGTGENILGSAGQGHSKAEDPEGKASLGRNALFHILKAYSNYDEQVGYCFSEDHELLTNHGFLSLEQMLHRERLGIHVTVATTDAKTQKIQYQIPLTLIVNQPQQNQQMVEFSATVGGNATESSPAQVSLLVTPEHHMYIQSESIEQFEKCTAAEILRDCERAPQFHFQAAVPNGVASPSTSLPLDECLELNDESSLQQFLQQLGSFIQHGQIPDDPAWTAYFQSLYSSSPSIATPTAISPAAAFRTVSSDALRALHITVDAAQRLVSDGLRPRAVRTNLAHLATALGHYEALQMGDACNIILQLQDTLHEEFGRNRSGDAASFPMQQLEKALSEVMPALTRQSGLVISQLNPIVGRMGESHLLSCSGEYAGIAQLSLRAMLQLRSSVIVACGENVATAWRTSRLLREVEQSRQSIGPITFYQAVVDSDHARTVFVVETPELADADSVPAIRAALYVAQCLASGVPMSMEQIQHAHTLSQCRSRPDSLPSWVWNLNAKQARALLKGMMTADEEYVDTKSASLREEIVRLAFHAGYAPFFHRIEGMAGEKDTSATWRITLCSSEESRRPQLNRDQNVRKVVDYTGRTWCVNVPNGLIVARRIMSHDATGAPSHTSLPIVAGNCQGMGFPAGLFLMYMPEEEAFWMLHCISRGEKYLLHGMWSPGFPLLFQWFHSFSKLLAKHVPKLSKHLLAQEPPIVPELYATHWFMTLFSYNLPFEIVLRIWDILLAEGPKIIFRLAIFFCKTLEKQIVAEEDFAPIMDALKNLHQHPIMHDADVVINGALALNITRDELSKYEAEYQQIKFKESQQQMAQRKK